MKFAINIESGRGKYVFRLNNQNFWTRCSNSPLLSTTDYQTSDPKDIISKQEKDLTVRICSEDFEIAPELGTEWGNEKQLHYSIYGFRRNYPKPPEENQLRQLLLSGNDTELNTLVLKIDAQFYLLSQNQIIDNPTNPECVGKFEVFQPNNGFVGSSINNDEMGNYVQNIFKIAIYHWVEHLKYKKLNVFMDLDLNSGADHIPGIIDLFSELGEIRNKWKADY